MENPSNITVNNNNLTAPDTEPITKQDIKQTPNPGENLGGKPVEKPNDKPVTKQDVNNSEEETVENNKLTNAYNDMMSRWNKLNK